MSNSKVSSRFSFIFELLAYIISIWNILILFFEPVINHYVYIISAQKWTAVINIIVMFIALLFRLLSKPLKDHRYRTISDGIILLLGSFLLLFDVKFVIFFLLVRQTFYIVRYFFFHAFEGALSKKLLKNPPVTFMLSFALIILSGTILLMLPSATVSHKVTPFINALFTATSATCVTGLVIVDTGSYFTLFGQLIILFMIQVGGLGIMTISTAFAILLGQRLNLSITNLMRDVTGKDLYLDIFALLKNVVIMTVIFEAIGTVFLFFTFQKYYEPSQALYYAIFHSISAFCNAGFSLFSNSFMDYAFNININLVITFLIIFGGIGFPVIIDVLQVLSGQKRINNLTLHTKIVMTTTIVLLLSGTLAFFVSEYYYTMKGFTIPQRLICSWFQSVTCRTAGFNTINESQIGQSSSLISIALMFIGASPGSTGGGIKTTTFTLLILSIISLMRGQNDITAFKRKININTLKDSTSLISLSMFFIGVIVFLILLIDSFDLEKTVFEAVSAFGTVGLSRGITPYLSTISKYLIVILMYIGRVGPLTLLYAFAQRRKPLSFSYAEEKISL